jgi:hypothetical protein
MIDFKWCAIWALAVSLVINSMVFIHHIREVEQVVKTLEVQYNYLALELSMGNKKNFQGEYLIQRDMKLKEKR